MSNNDWKKGIDLDLVCRRIERHKKRDKQGNVVFHGVEAYTDKIVLTEMFDIDDQISDNDKEHIVNKAIFNIGKQGKITAEKLKRSIDNLVKEYYESENKHYVYVASLSINNHFLLKRRRINGCTITFHANLDRTFHNGYNEQKEQYDLLFQNKFPQNYIYAKVFIPAKSPNHANLKATLSLGLLRGIWNLGLNKNQGLRINLGGPSKPANKITLGPIQTIHEIDGKLATKDFWYQPEYQRPLTVYNSPEQVESLICYEKDTREKIKNHAYKSDIEKALIRYVEALDLYNFQDSFIRLWGLLETLTSKEFKSHSEMIKKTLFHFTQEHRDYVRQMLKFLKEYRNKAVHMGSNSKNIVTHVYMLKQFVEALLQFHITNHFKFNTLKEATEFFELTQDENEFKKQMKLLKNLKSYRSW